MHVGGQYCCVIPRTGRVMTFCVQVLLDGPGKRTSQENCVSSMPNCLAFPNYDSILVSDLWSHANLQFLS